MLRHALSVSSYGFHLKREIFVMKYTNVQFVGYSVSTHPKTYGDDSLYRFYPGLADDQADLEARLALLETAFLLAKNFF